MEWTPTNPPRALSNFPPIGPSPHRAFNQAPAEANPGAFWFNLPPAPIHPAAKARNPPRKALIVEKPVTRDEAFGFGRGTLGGGGGWGNGNGNGKGDKEVAFKEAEFFAPENDLGNGLANLMESSFTLREDPATTDTSTSTSTKPAPRPLGANPTRLAETLLLALLLSSWIYATAGSGPPHADTLLGVLGVALLILLRVVAETARDLRERRWSEDSVAANVGLVLCLLELVGVTHVAMGVWEVKRGGEGGRVGVDGGLFLGGMVLHGAWSVLHKGWGVLF